MRGPDPLLVGPVSMVSESTLALPTPTSVLVEQVWGSAPVSIGQVSAFVSVEVARVKAQASILVKPVRGQAPVLIESMSVSVSMVS